MIGALTNTLLLGGNDFPEGHDLRHNDTNVGPSIHGMLTELMFKLDLDRSGEDRQQMPTMRAMVAITSSWHREGQGFWTTDLPESTTYFMARLPTRSTQDQAPEEDKGAERGHRSPHYELVGAT